MEKPNVYASLIQLGASLMIIRAEREAMHVALLKVIQSCVPPVRGAEIVKEWESDRHQNLEQAILSVGDTQPEVAELIQKTLRDLGHKPPGDV